MKGVGSARQRERAGRKLPARRGPAASARHFRLLGWGAAALLAGTIVAVAVFDRVDNPLCATRSEQELVRTELARGVTPDIEILSRELHVSPAVILDAWPANRRVGVRASELPVIWKWLREWPEPVLSWRSGRHLLQVRGSLPELRVVTQRGYWDLAESSDGLSGRLDVSGVGAIYAYYPRPEQDSTLSIIFLDRQGEMLFRIDPVSVPGTGRAAPDAHTTRIFRRLKGLPQVCPETG